MKNPFNYLQFAKGDQFYDRREILADLRSRFLSGQTNVVIYGPRRYGKSSLVSELAEWLENAGIICFTFDMVKMATVSLFAEAYATRLLSPTPQTSCTANIPRTETAPATRHAGLRGRRCSRRS